MKLLAFSAFLGLFVVSTSFAFSPVQKAQDLASQLGLISKQLAQGKSSLLEVGLENETSRVLKTDKALSEKIILLDKDAKSEDGMLMAQPAEHVMCIRYSENEAVKSVMREGLSKEEALSMLKEMLDILRKGGLSIKNGEAECMIQLERSKE